MSVYINILSHTHTQSTHCVSEIKICGQHQYVEQCKVAETSSRKNERKEKSSWKHTLQTHL